MIGRIASICASIQHAMSGAKRSKWFTVHRWLGVGLGVWFALVGLSGGILVFEDPIDAWLNPRLLTTANRGPHLSA